MELCGLNYCQYWNTCKFDGCRAVSDLGSGEQFWLEVVLVIEMRLLSYFRLECDEFSCSFVKLLWSFAPNEALKKVVANVQYPIRCHLDDICTYSWVHHLVIRMMCIHYHAGSTVHTCFIISVYIQEWSKICIRLATHHFNVAFGCFDMVSATCEEN